MFWGMHQHRDFSRTLVKLEPCFNIWCDNVRSKDSTRIIIHLISSFCDVNSRTILFFLIDQYKIIDVTLKVDWPWVKPCINILNTVVKLWEILPSEPDAGRLIDKNLKESTNLILKRQIRGKPCRIYSCKIPKACMTLSIIYLFPCSASPSTKLKKRERERERMSFAVFDICLLRGHIYNNPLQNNTENV